MVRAKTFQSTRRNGCENGYSSEDLVRNSATEVLGGWVAGTLAVKLRADSAPSQAARVAQGF